MTPQSTYTNSSVMFSCRQQQWTKLLYCSCGFFPSSVTPLPSRRLAISKAVWSSIKISPGICHGHGAGGTPTWRPLVMFNIIRLKLSLATIHTYLSRCGSESVIEILLLSQEWSCVVIFSRYIENALLGRAGVVVLRLYMRLRCGSEASPSSHSVRSIKVSYANADCPGVIL
jgi:hypothetical protein